MKPDGILTAAVLAEMLATSRINGWDKAIFDAKRGIKRLQLAVEFFEEQRSRGASWDQFVGTCAPPKPKRKVGHHDSKT